VLETALIGAERRTRIGLRRAVLRFINGVGWLVRDPSSAVGRTAYSVIHRDGKLTVRRYRAVPGSRRRRHAIPVLLIPPLMVKPFIFDLFPGRSLIEFLLARGFRVYLVDFGEPDDADALVTLDDYVLRWIPAACAAVKKDARVAELSLLGYCLGATFALAHTAANRDRSVRNIVDIAAPVDVDALGAFSWVLKVAAVQAEAIVRRIGNVPGGLSSAVFRALTPGKNVLRYLDLFLNMWNREYVKGFEAMNEWIRQFVDYPQEAFLQFSREFVRKNKFVKGKMRFGRKRADLRHVRASLLVIAGRNDRIAPIRPVRAILAAVGSRDTEFVVAPGGHMGVFAGQTAPEHVWRRIADWLEPRSQAQRRTGRATSHRRTVARPRRYAGAGRDLY
jgi:polyhydroxyalkanoate synthase